MIKGAIFSDCRRYRYALFRDWMLGEAQPWRRAVIIGLNPSTADETEDDPTIRRCINFSKAWGYDGLVMLNLFAWRSTDPSALHEVDDPVGPANDRWIRFYIRDAGVVVAAWGTHGALRGRDIAVAELVPELHALRATKDGHPAHPLYLPAHLQPARWHPRRISSSPSDE